MGQPDPYRPIGRGPPAKVFHASKFVSTEKQKDTKTRTGYAASAGPGDGTQMPVQTPGAAPILSDRASFLHTAFFRPFSPGPSGLTIET